MVAQNSPRKTSPSENTVATLRRKSLVSDPEDMLLLREKLNRIAVDMFSRKGRCSSTDYNNNESMMMTDDGEEMAAGSDGVMLESPKRNEHFQVFPLRERPSTPPSSPQPRDVLRKQLRMKNARSFRLEDHQQQRQQQQQETMDTGMNESVYFDGVEISRLELDNAVGQQHQIRLSIPDHLRVVSTFSVMNKCPEGLRKRKSFHVEDAHSACVDGRLKKSFSQINVLTSWDTTASPMCHQDDHDMEEPCLKSTDALASSSIEPHSEVQTYS